MCSICPRRISATYLALVLIYIYPTILKAFLNLGYIFFFFLGLLFQHMEVSRLGLEWELQLPDYTTAMATLNPTLMPQLAAILDP